MKQTAVEQLIEKMSLEDVCKYSNQLADAKEMEKEYKQKVNLLLDTLLENNMCSVVGDKLIQIFKTE